MMTLDGRVAAVTGSGQGIGASVARKLAAAGASVVVNDVSAARAEEIACSIASEGLRAIAQVGDIGTAEGAEALVTHAVSEFGSIDVLVNNAGIARDSWLAKMKESDWDEIIRVNLKGQFLCARAAVPHMMQKRYGRIVNISSRAWLGGPGQANYAASKGGVVSLTRTLALELAKFGITVNCVAPGFIDTPLSRSLPEEVRERLIRAIPIGRIGEPEDIAQAVLSFACDEASFITGQVLYACGGRSILASSGA